MFFMSHKLIVVFVDILVSQGDREKTKELSQWECVDLEGQTTSLFHHNEFKYASTYYFYDYHDWLCVVKIYSASNIFFKQFITLILYYILYYI